MMDLVIDYELIVTENFDPLLMEDQVLSQVLLYELGADDSAPIYAEP